MADDDMKEEFKVIMLPEVQAAIDADPELAQAVREFSACARQAMAGIKSGQYNTSLSMRPCSPLPGTARSQST